MGQQPMQFGFAGCQKYHIIRIPEIMPDMHLLFDPVVKVGEIQVGQILAQIVSDR